MRERRHLEVVAKIERELEENDQAHARLMATVLELREALEKDRDDERAP